MNMPGFNAEASSYKSSRSYIGSVHTYSGDQSQILPATIPWIFPWIITHEIAKDCDQGALQDLANGTCRQAAVQMMAAIGWSCSAECLASDFGHDSNCQPTGGGCHCSISDCNPL
jgi:hypothetical protein